MAQSGSVISVEYRGRVAIITINNEAKLNALNLHQYYELAQKLREVATHDEVYITLLTGKGRFFSAGADIGTFGEGTPNAGAADAHNFWLRSFVANNLNITHAFYTHPKVLVVGLNGPTVGLSAALAAFGDFIYGTPETFLLTPFASLGLVAEGGASRALVARLGVTKANEALLMAKRIPATELLAAGFLNQIFDVPKGPGQDAKFQELVLKEIDNRLGEHLVGESLLGIKKLLRRHDNEVLDRQNYEEVFAGLDRFMTGVPQEEFAKLASGQKRHKL